jgi:hypothetical protein
LFPSFLSLPLGNFTFIFLSTPSFGSLFFILKTHPHNLTALNLSISLDLQVSYLLSPLVYLIYYLKILSVAINLLISALVHVQFSATYANTGT